MTGTLKTAGDRRWRAGWLMLMVVMVWARCDTIEPEEGPRLVVEAFLDAGKPLPPVILRRTVALTAPGYDTPVTDADVLLTLDGTPVPYAPDPARPGQYVSVEGGGMVPARARYDLRVRWQGQEATAAGEVPPPVRLDSVQVHVPDHPVQAILLDSLNFGLDSLNVDAREGFIYPVEVTLWWGVDFGETGPDSVYWIQTRLQPREAFSSSIIDFFLLPEAVFRERTVPRDGAGQRSWTGVYAVPVEKKSDPIPPHGLKVTLLRSRQDYARFADSRNAPDRREPFSNVSGALGIVAGLSVDSLFVGVKASGRAAFRH